MIWLPMDCVFDVVDAEFSFVVARYDRRASILKVVRCYAIIDTMLNRNGRGRAAVTSSRFHRAIIDHVRPFGKRSEIDAGYPLNETLYRLISLVDLVEISLFTMFFINRKYKLTFRIYFKLNHMMMTYYK